MQAKEEAMQAKIRATEAELGAKAREMQIQQEELERRFEELEAQRHSLMEEASNSRPLMTPTPTGSPVRKSPEQGKPQDTTFQGQQLSPVAEEADDRWALAKPPPSISRRQAVRSFMQCATSL